MIVAELVSVLRTVTAVDDRIVRVTGSAFVSGWIHLPGGGTATGGSSGATLHQIFWVEGILP